MGIHQAHTRYNNWVGQEQLAALPSICGGVNWFEVFLPYSIDVSAQVLGHKIDLVKVWQEPGKVALEDLYADANVVDVLDHLPPIVVIRDSRRSK